MKLKLSVGRMAVPLKTVIYGPEGIGKSTFAGKFPAPIFIDTEGSTRHMNVTRIDPAPAGWAELLEVIRELSGPSYAGGYDTLVLDTADWAEMMCARHLCQSRGVTGIEDFGYGKGYTYLAEEFAKLLGLLDGVWKSGHNVVVTAHAAMRKFEQPDELGAYDRWELKLQKKTAPLLKEWADMVLFANYKTIVVNVDNQGAAKGKNKVQGGSRVMYTSHHPCWDAKNRFGLPDEMPLDYEGIAHIVPDRAALEASAEAQEEAPAPEPPKPPEAAPAQEKKAAPKQSRKKAEKAAQTAQPAQDSEDVPGELRSLMEAGGVTAREVREAVARVGYYPVDTPIASYDAEFIQGVLVADWQAVEQMILSMREETPF